jgi:hypothetical protein
MTRNEKKGVAEEGNPKKQDSFLHPTPMLDELENGQGLWQGTRRWYSGWKVVSVFMCRCVRLDR